MFSDQCFHSIKGITKVIISKECLWSNSKYFHKINLSLRSKTLTKLITSMTWCGIKYPCMPLFIVYVNLPVVITWTTVAQTVMLGYRKCNDIQQGKSAPQDWWWRVLRPCYYRSCWSMVVCQPTHLSIWQSIPQYGSYLLFSHSSISVFTISIKELQFHALLKLDTPLLPQLQQLHLLCFQACELKATENKSKCG